MIDYTGEYKCPRCGDILVVENGDVVCGNLVDFYWPESNECRYEMTPEEPPKKRI